MSGGSLNYLFSKTEASSIINSINDLIEAKDYLIYNGYLPEALIVNTLIDFIQDATDFIEKYHEQISPILKSIEYVIDGDQSEDELDTVINRFRTYVKSLPDSNLNNKS